MGTLAQCLRITWEFTTKFLFKEKKKSNSKKKVVTYHKFFFFLSVVYLVCYLGSVV